MIMKFIYSCQTDKGDVRQSNQDALLVKSVCAGNDTALLAVVCDGVGGLSQGERASRKAVEMFAEWANYEWAQILKLEEKDEVLEYRFRQLIKNINRELFQFSHENGISLGTTMSAILIWEYQFLVGHVGDSRIYRIMGEDNVTQLTEDHSWVAQEVKAGRLTLEEARNHPHQNWILKCLGVDVEISPQIKWGEIEKDSVIILCTDGFWHQVNKEEWCQYFSPNDIDTTDSLKAKMSSLLNQVRQRGETDNITAVAIKVF